MTPPLNRFSPGMWAFLPDLPGGVAGGPLGVETGAQVCRGVGQGLQTKTSPDGSTRGHQPFMDPISVGCEQGVGQ